MVYKKLSKFEFGIAIFTAVLIALIYMSLNFNYLSKWVDEKGDVLTYDYYVRLGIPQYLFNPHHIGFDWAGQQLYKAMKSNGYTGTSMAALQIRNLLVSSIGLGVIFFLFYKISKKFLLSLLIVICYSFTAAYWIYSQINDTPIIHSILIFIVFLASLYFPQAKRKFLYAFFLGLLHALTIFFHQSDLIMMAVIVFVMFFSNILQSENKNIFFSIKNTKYFLTYLLTFTVIVVVAYYYVGVVLIDLTLDPDKAEDLNKISGSTYFFNWLILYAKIDYWGKGFEDKSLFAKAVNGIITYFYQPQSFNGKNISYNFAAPFAAESILPNFIGFLFITVFTGTFLLIRKIYGKYNYSFIAVLIYMAVYASFTCWWEADYREFWVSPMFSFWFLSLIFFSTLLDLKHAMTPVVKITVYTFIILLASLLFYFNFTGFIHPNAGSDYRSYEITKDLH